jgi:hypothetical protein
MYSKFSTNPENKNQTWKELKTCRFKASTVMPGLVILEPICMDSICNQKQLKYLEKIYEIRIGYHV